MTSVFPPPKRAQVKLRSTSVSTCVDTEASLEILETARVAPTWCAKRHAISDRDRLDLPRKDDAGGRAINLIHIVNSADVSSMCLEQFRKCVRILGRGRRMRFADGETDAGLSNLGHYDDARTRVGR